MYERYEGVTPTAPPTELGMLLKASMTKQSMSMRNLSKQSGVSTATISRIIAGKQLATIHHLQQFAQHLRVPMETLLASIGVANMKQDTKEQGMAGDIIQDIFQDFQIDLDVVAANVVGELEKLEHYARTKEGKKVILDSFQPKMRDLDSAGAIIDKLNHFYALFCSEEITGEKQVVVGSVLLYFVLTIGVIPDYLFPIGYLDDAIAVKIVEKKLALMPD